MYNKVSSRWTIYEYFPGYKIVLLCIILPKIRWCMDLFNGKIPKKVIIVLVYLLLKRVSSASIFLKRVCRFINDNLKISSDEKPSNKED